jgi:hypothetical protein
MRILFLVSAHNSLSQRAWIELTELSHEVGVAMVDSASAMKTAVRVHAPDLIACPFLKTLIPNRSGAGIAAGATSAPTPAHHHARERFVYKLPAPDTTSEEPTRVAI